MLTRKSTIKGGFVRATTAIIIALIFSSSTALAQCTSGEVITLAKQGYSKGEITKLCAEKSAINNEKQSGDPIPGILVKAIKTRKVGKLPSYIDAWRTTGNGESTFSLHQEVTALDVTSMHRLCGTLNNYLTNAAAQMKTEITNNRKLSGWRSDDCSYEAPTGMQTWVANKNGIKVSVQCNPGFTYTCRGHDGKTAGFASFSFEVE